MATNGRLFANTSASVIAVLVAVAGGGIIIALLGHDPLAAIYTMFDGALGNNYGLGSTLNLTAILLSTGLAAFVAFRAGVWNFGMEGQLYLGGLGAVGVVFGLPSLGVLVVPTAILAGTVFGGLFAALAGVLKVKLGVTEAVSTLLFNYIAYLTVDYVTGGPLRQPGAALNTTPPVPPQFTLQNIPGTTIQPYFIVGIVVSIALFYLLKKTKFGFETRVMGANYRAAQYVGIKTGRRVLLTMLISGSLAGFAGCLLVLGSSYSLFIGVSKSYGWLGVAVALLGSLHPIAIIFSSFFFAILNVGGGVMQSKTGVPYEVAQVVSALVVIIVLIRPILRKVIWHGP